MGMRLFRMGMRLGLCLAEKEGVVLFGWKRRAGEDHYAAQSGYAAAENVFEMLAQLLGDGGVRLSGQ